MLRVRGVRARRLHAAAADHRVRPIAAFANAAADLTRVPVAASRDCAGSWKAIALGVPSVA